MQNLPALEASPEDRFDLQPFLDQELCRLPDKYRIPIVLCDLEGKTQKEAARQMGVPEGTLSARLAQVDPANATFYQQRGADFQKRWTEATALRSPHWAVIVVGELVDSVYRLDGWLGETAIRGPDRYSFFSTRDTELERRCADLALELRPERTAEARLHVTNLSTRARVRLKTESDSSSARLELAELEEMLGKCDVLESKYEAAAAALSPSRRSSPSVHSGGSLVSRITAPAEARRSAAASSTARPSG